MLKDIILNRYNSVLSKIENVITQYNILQKVNIVAVSKYTTSDIIKDFLSLKLDVPLAESKAQSLRDRCEIIKGADWHFIGRIQKNKVKYIVKFSSLIQSVDSLEVAIEIDKEARKILKVQDILLQFNISNEEQKGGFNTEYFRKYYEDILKLSNIKINGVMGVATYTNDDIVIEKEFESLHNIYESIRSEYNESQFNILSMGMSSDYELAVKHYSNMVRIGSVLFSDL